MEALGLWRLPTVKELITLQNSASSDKEMKPYYYWSSSTGEATTSNAWSVCFYKGFDYWDDKTDSNYVRCVRDTPNGLEWDKTAPFKMTWQEAMDYAEKINKEAT